MPAGRATKLEGLRMRFFLRGDRQAIDAARPAGKALRELRIADPHMEQRGVCDRQCLDDRLDEGLVTGGLLVAPVDGIPNAGDPKLLAVATVDGAVA